MTLQSKESRYNNGMIYLKSKEITNQKHTKESQKKKKKMYHIK